MTDDRTNTELTLEEQLVAYLDGELDAEESHRIEELLLKDPEVRQVMQGLDRTWDMLDELDRPRLDDRFTQSTLEMVTVAATKDVKEAVADAPRKRRRRWALSAFTLLLAGLAGFAAVAWWTSGRNRQLVRDLPVLVDLDSYRQIEDLDFLRLLRDQGLFAEVPPRDDEPSDASLVVSADEPIEDPAAARQIIETMSLAEQEQLLQRYKRFTSLSSNERKNIRQFYDRLEQAPDGDQLRGLMRQYHQWLKTLPPYEKAKLVDLDPQARIEHIRQLLEVERQKQVLAQDVEGMSDWITEYATRNEERLLKLMPERFRPHLSQVPEQFRYRLFGILIWGPRPDASGENRIPLATEDLDDLCSHLSEQTQAKLQGLSDADRWQIIREAVRSAFQQRLFGANRGLLSQTPEEELDRFFNDELTTDEQEHLLSLPGDEMQRELRMKYFAKKYDWKFPSGRPRRGTGGWGPRSREPDRRHMGPSANGPRPEHRMSPPGLRPNRSGGPEGG